MLTDQNPSQEEGDSIDTLVNKAITNYKTAIKKENKGWADLSPQAIEQYIKHVQPLMLKLCKQIKTEVPEVYSTLQEFLMNFSDIGKSPRIPDSSGPHVSLARTFYNNGSDWGKYRDPSSIPNPPIEDQLDTLSAIKLHVLERAGILRRGFEELDKYELARFKHGYATFNDDIRPGCFGHAMAWFSGKINDIPNTLFFALKEFYREIIRPTTDTVDRIKKEVVEGKFSNTFNHYDSDKPYG